MSAAEEADVMTEPEPVSPEDLENLVGEPLGESIVEVNMGGETVYMDLSELALIRHGEPPSPRLVRVTDAGSVVGKRLVWVRADTGRVVRDLRAASEVFTDSSGSYIRQVREAQWYLWMLDTSADRPPACPRAITIRTTNVWVEAVD